LQQTGEGEGGEFGGHGVPVVWSGREPRRGACRARTLLVGISNAGGEGRLIRCSHPP
jgi:hypothetical protein